MTGNFTIRPVEAGDFEAVQSILKQEAERHNFTPEADSPYHPDNSAAHIIRATLDPQDVNRGWLAFAEGRPAGLITTPQDLPGGVFVTAEFRGQGIAQALVKERERYFKEEMGLTEITRPVRADNAASIALHTQKLGYSFSQASLNLLKETPKPPGHTVLYLTKKL